MMKMKVNLILMLLTTSEFMHKTASKVLDSDLITGKVSKVIRK